MTSNTEAVQYKGVAKKKNPAAVALGRMGGMKSAKGRMAKMTPAERSRVARNAVRVRWAKRRREK